MTSKGVDSCFKCCFEDVPGLSSPSHVEQFRSEVSSALLDYCNMSNMDSEFTSDKFGQLLLQLSEIKLISLLLENYLYEQHLAGNTTDSNLLVEILHSCRQWLSRQFAMKSFCFHCCTEVISLLLCFCLIQVIVIGLCVIIYNCNPFYVVFVEIDFFW